MEVKVKKLFQAFDGTIFETDQEAIDYELFCRQPAFVIVDDDPDILELISKRLERAKIKHQVFQDPLKAMNYISKNKIARVFTDYHMKNFGMSGKWIKEICEQYNVNCSIVSGDEKVADISKIEFVKDCIPFIKSFSE